MEENPPARDAPEKEHRQIVYDSYLQRFHNVENEISTADKEAEACTNEHMALEKLAEHDAATGLYNKLGFKKALNRDISQLGRLGKRGAVLAIDVDRLKAVNDTYGHATGDELIKAVAEAIKGHTRQGDLAARIGGDEFALLLYDTDTDEAREVAARLLAFFMQSAKGKDYQISSLSIGICATGTYTPNEMMEHADKALYQAKKTRNAISTYNPTGQ